MQAGDIQAIGSAAERFGIPFAQTVLIFLLMRKQDDRHVKEWRDSEIRHVSEMKIYADNLNAIRKENNERMALQHDRSNQLMIEVLSVVRENSKATAELSAIIKGFKREYERD